MDGTALDQTVLKNPLGVSGAVIAAMREHALADAPKEACGLIVDGPHGDPVYKRCKNVHDEPERYFHIRKQTVASHMASKTLRAVFHSHPHAQGPVPFASRADMVGQIDTGVPWVLLHQVGDGSWTGPWWWGDQLPVAPLIGRPFVSGVYDCYSNVRSYFKLERDILIKDYVREHEWWLDPEQSNLFIDGFEEAGFREINFPDMVPGDCVIGCIMGNRAGPNHCGVYLGDNLLLHHLFNRVSRRDNLSNWQRYITHAVRYDP